MYKKVNEMSDSKEGVYTPGRLRAHVPKTSEKFIKFQNVPKGTSGTEWSLEHDIDRRFH